MISRSKRALDVSVLRRPGLNTLKWPRSRKISGELYSHAVRVCETCVGPRGQVEVWKYAFPLASNRQVEDLRVRMPTSDGSWHSGPEWTGMFECACGRHVDVLPWPAANAVVVAAANALYIVDPSNPEQFSGFAAPVEIKDVIFDESAEHMFVADSVRIYAFSQDRLLQWISEPLDGYEARFRGCGGRVLTIERKQLPEKEGEEAAPSFDSSSDGGRDHFALAFPSGPQLLDEKRSCLAMLAFYPARWDKLYVNAG